MAEKKKNKEGIWEHIKATCFLKIALIQIIIAEKRLIGGAASFLHNCEKAHKRQTHLNEHHNLNVL